MEKVHIIVVRFINNVEVIFRKRWEFGKTINNSKSKKEQFPNSNFFKAEKTALL